MAAFHPKPTDGLGGGIELIGGLWVLLVSTAALRSGELPKALNLLGLLIGIAGILTVVPAFSALVDLFGLAQILWFAALGIVMLRNGQRDLPEAREPLARTPLSSD